MMILFFFFTEEAVLGYVLVNVSQVTSGLEVSSVGVEVVMSHSLLDAHAEAHAFLGEGVDGVHKICIIGRQSVGGRHALEQRPRWIQTWADGKREFRAVPTGKGINSWNLWSAHLWSFRFSLDLPGSSQRSQRCALQGCSRSDEPS